LEDTGRPNRPYHQLLRERIEKEVRKKEIREPGDGLDHMQEEMMTPLLAALEEIRPELEKDGVFNLRLGEKEALIESMNDAQEAGFGTLKLKIRPRTRVLDAHDLFGPAYHRVYEIRISNPVGDTAERGAEQEDWRVFDTFEDLHALMDCVIGCCAAYLSERLVPR